MGLAAAPVFPLLTVTTPRRAGAAAATWTVSLQVAASAIGGAVVPACLGVAIGASSAQILAPLLTVLSLAMCGAYRLLARTARAHPPRTP